MPLRIGLLHVGREFRCLSKFAVSVDICGVCRAVVLVTFAGDQEGEIKDICGWLAPRWTQPHRDLLTDAVLA